METMEHRWEQLLGEAVVRTEYFRMFEFKIQRCPWDRPHDWTQCPFAHPTEKAKRRNPTRYKYNGTACADFRKNGVCRRGDACPFAHGVFEAWLHPARYRTKMCTDGDKCVRHVCFFAHSETEIREPTPEILDEVSQLKQQLLSALQSSPSFSKQLERLYATLGAAAEEQKIRMQQQRQQSGALRALLELRAAHSMGLLGPAPNLLLEGNGSSAAAKLLMHHLAPGCLLPSYSPPEVSSLAGGKDYAAALSPIPEDYFALGHHFGLGASSGTSLGHGKPVGPVADVYNPLTSLAFPLSWDGCQPGFQAQALAEGPQQWEASDPTKQEVLLRKQSSSPPGSSEKSLSHVPYEVDVPHPAVRPLESRSISSDNSTATNQLLSSSDAVAGDSLFSLSSLGLYQGWQDGSGFQALSPNSVICTPPDRGYIVEHPGRHDKAALRSSPGLARNDVVCDARLASLLTPDELSADPGGPDRPDGLDSAPHKPACGVPSTVLKGRAAKGGGALPSPYLPYLHGRSISAVADVISAAVANGDMERLPSVDVMFSELPRNVSELA